MDSRLNLTDEENELYTKLFVQCDLEGFGYVSGNTTCDLFRRSGLTDEVLFSIWEIADKTNSGQLDFMSFCVCLRLIGHVQIYGPHALRDSDLLINKAPEELPFFGGGAFAPQDNTKQNTSHEVDHGLYLISNSDFEGYKYTFLQLSPELNDFLTGDDARTFYLNTTNLSQDDLMHLWSLADADKDGRLSFREFCVMQKLCDCLKLYGTLPTMLPQPLFQFLEANDGDYMQVPSVKTASHYKLQTEPGYHAPNDNSYQAHAADTRFYAGNEPESRYLPPVTETEFAPKSPRAFGQKGIPSDNFVGENAERPPATHVTNDLIVQCENLLSTLRDAINTEKMNLATSGRESSEIETKLKSDTKTLENLLTEYRSLVGDSHNMAKRRSLLTHKLSIIQDQIQEMRDQIQSIRVGNVALNSNIDKNNEELSVLQNTRQMFLRQLEEENNLLKQEERDLAEMSNCLQQLRRQRDLLNEKNVQLKECLSQSENATKTMLRSIQLQQGKIMSVRSERINLLEEKIKLTGEINRLNNSDNNLNSSSQSLSIGAREGSNEVSVPNKSLNLDSKGIRVSSMSLKVGDEFPK